MTRKKRLESRALDVYFQDTMLWTIVVILAVLWLLGMVTSTTMGGLVHLLLVLAIIVVLVNFIKGRRTV